METNCFHQLLEDIGNRLYTIRHQRREKLTSVATAIGISHPVISQVENGRYKGLTLDLLLRLSNHYNINIQDLLVAEGNASRKTVQDDLIVQHLKTENAFLKDILLKQQTATR